MTQKTLWELIWADRYGTNSAVFAVTFQTITAPLTILKIKHDPLHFGEAQGSLMAYLNEIHLLFSSGTEIVKSER